MPGLVPGAFQGEPLPASLAGAELHPLALPLVFSGFDPDTFGWARGVFSSMGFAPLMGGGGGGTSPGPIPDLAPGATVGVSLVEGDLDLSVSGTVTHLDRDRVYAFGHPFYNLGPTQFPLRKAWVHAIFPSLQVSWKIASATDAIGTLDQDRTTAVSGKLGPLPQMMGVVVRLRSPRSSERVFRFRVVEDELLTPLLTYVSLLSVLQGHERAFGAATLRVEAALTLAGGREVKVEDVVASEQPAQQAAAVVAGPLALLAANDFEKVAVETLDADGGRGREPRGRHPGARVGRRAAAAAARQRGAGARAAAHPARRKRHRDAVGRAARERHGRQLHAARGRRPHHGPGGAARDAPGVRAARPRPAAARTQQAAGGKPHLRPASRGPPEEPSWAASTCRRSRGRCSRC